MLSVLSIGEISNTNENKNKKLITQTEGTQKLRTLERNINPKINFQIEITF